MLINEDIMPEPRIQVLAEHQLALGNRVSSWSTGLIPNSPRDITRSPSTLNGTPYISFTILGEMALPVWYLLSIFHLRYVLEQRKDFNHAVCKTIGQSFGDRRHTTVPSERSADEEG